jgi:hypothetical protein
VNRYLDFLMSAVYDGSLATEHLADLRKSGLTADTIRCQKDSLSPARHV